jgi:hypothetical protein
MAYKALEDLTTERQEYDFTEDIHKLDAKIDPLTVLTNQIGKRGTTTGVVHYWYHEELDNRWDTINGTPASNSTVITVDNYSRFHKWDVCTIPETTWFGICNDDSLDATVEFIVLQNGSGTVTDGENILIMGPAIEEGSPGADPYQGAVTGLYNVTSTIQRPFSVTREMEDNAIHGGNELARLQNKKGRELARDIELYLWHNERYQSTGVTGTKNLSLNGGIFYYLTGSGDGNANTTSATTLTEATWQTFLSGEFTYVDECWVFMSEIIQRAVDNWARGKLRLAPESKEYGLKITEYPMTGKRALLIDARRILEDGADADKTDFGGHAVALDLSDIKLLWYPGGEPKLNTHIETAKQSLNRREDAYQAQFTIEVGDSKRHSVLSGVSAIG